MFVDCGVFDLNSSIDYINWCNGRLSRILAIESDNNCFRKIKMDIDGAELSALKVL